MRGAGAPLPFAAREVLDVAELFAAGDAERRAIDEAREGFAARLEAGEDPGGVSLSGARFRVHLGDRASEAALKRDPWLEGADVVLLACHGIADLTSPALSCLLLGSSGEGGGGHEDGLLSLRELRDLHARCDLMILSACASKAGVLRPYEGTAGLAAAALAGGAETVLCTLWEVRDRSAARLVADFCRRRIAAGRTAADALAGAKRAALREGMPLGTWAAYTVWGAGACR